MQDENKQVENGKQILKQIKDLQNSYESYKIDESEEEMSFIDKVNRLIQSIMGDSTVSIYEVLSEKRLSEWNKKRISRFFKRLIFGNLTNFLYFIFLTTITGFLVSEALSFYAIDGIISTNTFLKAILTETSFIFLSGYKTSNKIQAIWVGFLRVCIFCLMLFVISSQTLTTGTEVISENQAIAEQMVFVEKRIEEKEKEIVYYRDVKNWPRNTRERILEKEVLVKKLIMLKDQQVSGKNISVSQVEEYKMYGRAIFRVLLLLISVLITRRIFVF